jgi:hypothetical protein
MLVLAEHRVDSYAKLITGRLRDAADIKLEVLEAIRCRSSATKEDFVVACLLPACTSHQLIVRDFLTLSLGVR